MSHPRELFSTENMQFRELDHHNLSTRKWRGTIITLESQKKNYFLRNQLIRSRVRREIKLVKIKFGDAKVAKRKLHKFNIDVMRRAEKFCTFDNQRFIIIFILKQINPSFSWFTFSHVSTNLQRVFNKLRRKFVHHSREIFGSFSIRREYLNVLSFLRLQDAGTTGFHLHRLKWIAGKTRCCGSIATACCN